MAPEASSDGTLAAERRWVFFIFNAFLWMFGAVFMAARISANGWTLAAFGLFSLFLLLQTQVVYGFTLAVTGWWVLGHRGDPVRINQMLPAGLRAGQFAAYGHCHADI